MKFITLGLCILLSLIANAQVDSTTPPYKKFPTLPPLQLLLADSTTKYTKENLPKKKPVWLILFSPDCNHCQHTAEELVKYKDDVRDIQIVMASMFSIKQIKDFGEKYALHSVPNLVIGKDMYFLIPPFYAVKSLPFMAFYNKKGDLISVFEGSMSVPAVLTLFREHQ